MRRTSWPRTPTRSGWPRVSWAREPPSPCSCSLCSSRWSGCNSAICGGWRGPRSWSLDRGNSLGKRRTARPTAHSVSADGHRAQVEEVGLLLHPAHPVRDRHAVPLLLDAHHGHPAGLGTLPLVARGQQHALLDAPADPRALPGPDGEDHLPALALEHLLHRVHLDCDLAVLRAPRGL